MELKEKQQLRVLVQMRRDIYVAQCVDLDIASYGSAQDYALEAFTNKTGIKPLNSVTISTSKV